MESIFTLKGIHRHKKYKNELGLGTYIPTRIGIVFYLFIYLLFLPIYCFDKDISKLPIIKYSDSIFYIGTDFKVKNANTTQRYI